MSKDILISFALPDDLHQEMAELSSLLGVPEDYIVGNALKQYVASEKQSNRYQDLWAEHKQRFPDAPLASDLEVSARRAAFRIINPDT